MRDGENVAYAADLWRRRVYLQQAQKSMSSEKLPEQEMEFNIGFNHPQQLLILFMHHDNTIFKYI